MPVDSSPYTIAPATQDPLAGVGKILQIQQGALALQGQAQELKARQALGPILQQSIDPQTGELDINKFLVQGAANPDVAWKMPEITLQMIQRQNTQADTVNKQLEANKVRYGAMGDAAGALVASAEEAAKKNVNIRTGGPGQPGISGQQFASALASFVGENGLIDGKDAAELVAKTATMTPQQRFQFIKQFATSALGVKDTMEKVYGAINPHNTGGGIAFTQENRLAGSQQNVGSGLTITPTPAELNKLETRTNAQGAPVPVARADIAPMRTGAGGIIPSTGTLAGPSGLSPNQEALQKARADTANKFDEDLNKANMTGQENLRILGEMRDALKAFKSGGGLAVRERIGTMLQGLGFPQKLIDDAAGGNLGAIQEFNKLAVRYATQEMQTYMGANQRLTNLDFSTFQKNNPTIGTDPRGLDKMFNFLKRGVWLVGQQQDAYQHWKTGHPPPGYENTDISSFPAYWAKELAKMNASKDKEAK